MADKASAAHDDNRCLACFYHLYRFFDLIHVRCNYGDFHWNIAVNIKIQLCLLYIQRKFNKNRARTAFPHQIECFFHYIHDILCL